MKWNWLPVSRRHLLRSGLRFPNYTHTYTYCDPRVLFCRLFIRRPQEVVSTFTDELLLNLKLNPTSCDPVHVWSCCTPVRIESIDWATFFTLFLVWRRRDTIQSIGALFIGNQRKQIDISSNTSPEKWLNRPEVVPEAGDTIPNEWHVSRWNVQRFV